MNYKIIFNALIIILILHLLINNLEFKEILDFSNHRENYANIDNQEKNNTQVENKTGNQQAQVENNSETSEIKEDFQNELLDYAKSLKFDSNNDILPGNYYESDENVPNFESNVANVSKFYKNNFDSLEKQDLINLDTSNKLINEVGCVGRQTNSSDDQPEYWKYQNELPMNGGKMGGVVGFDSLEGQYGLYDDNRNATGDSCNKSGIDLNIPSNDLRKPDIVN